MNAITPIGTIQSDVGQCPEFYTLCGQMTRYYARIEFDVVRAIEYLDRKGKTPSTLTQRTARLKVLLAGRTERLLKDIAQSLETLEDDISRRNILIHGSGAISIRGKGWLWPWEMRTGSKAVAERGFWTDQEMCVFQKGLRSKSDRLNSQVNRLCERSPN